MFRLNADGDDSTVANDSYHLLFISESNRHECPRVKIQIVNQEVSALIDTGCELSLMNEHVFNNLKHHGLEYLELPTQHVNLVSAFNRKSNRVKRQVWLNFKLGGIEIEQIVLLTPQLLTDAILGLDFLMEYLAIINFPEKSMSISANGASTNIPLCCMKDTDKLGQKDRASPEVDCGHLIVPFKHPRRVVSPSADSSQEETYYSTVGSEGGIGAGKERRGIRLSDGNSKQPVEVELVIPRRSDREEHVELPSKYDGTCRSGRSALSTLANDKEGHKVDKYIAAEYEINERSKKCEKVAADEIVVNIMNTEIRADTANRNKTLLGSNAQNRVQDSRDMTVDQLRKKVSECDTLSTQQQMELVETLKKYQPYFTKRPGRCTQFEYAFNVIGESPSSATSRPIPFVLREKVREQIKVMLKDGILEESFSNYVNPLTIVERGDKPIRICVDARRINQQMVADRTKVIPIREQLQRFHGARYITSLDLTSAFLQIPLKPESRKWTAFQFQGRVYEFTAVPYGTRNSQAAFIRALEQVFGDDEYIEYLVTYVDDILVHSATFAEHINHLNKVLCKLTTAGFTINAAKCQFCKPEIKFLGHVISDQTVKPDRDRTEAILRYPVPKTQKQLRRFLGICNFHKQFIINYASYVEPLLVLLRKGSKWKWSDELQQAFETLRAKFADSICLVHPDETKGWIINTDASGKAIGSVLMQENGQGGVNIVSTASRVLKPVEQRYTTCEKELLAIVDALQRFKVHIYGRKVILNTDNKALTFLNRCVITSNRVARWMMEVQEVDIEIRHIKGVDNYLADILSRSPSGLTDAETRDLACPDQIKVHRIQVYEDKTLRSDLQTIAALQDADTKLTTLKEQVSLHPNMTRDRYRIHNNVLYCQGGKTQKRWRAMLPAVLEHRVLQYVHLLLGHLGVDKCTAEINYVFHVNDLGRKLRKFIACCDVCQKVKHPNRAIDVKEKHHLPKEPGDICAIDIYGSLPVSKGGVKYILVCLDVFSGFVKLYALRANTTKACLNKIINRYITEVRTPKVILSDNATQFRSPSWRKQLQEHGIEVQFTPVRHPESNPSERCMRELGKFCRIYCHDSHKKWVELLPYIEKWVNQTVASSRGYTPHELMYGDKRHNLLTTLVPDLQTPTQDEEMIEEKLEKAYSQMKRRAEIREKRRKKGNATWQPKVNDKVLVRMQPMSDAIKGITAKFMYLYDGPFIISKVLNHSAFEIQDDSGTVRGEFNLKQLKPYREETVNAEK